MPFNSRIDGAEKGCQFGNSPAMQQAHPARPTAHNSQPAPPGTSQLQSTDQATQGVGVEQRQSTEIEDEGARPARQAPKGLGLPGQRRGIDGPVQGHDDGTTTEPDPHSQGHGYLSRSAG